MIQKGFKFRIYPNKSQEVFLMKSFGCNRLVYNLGLECKIMNWNSSRRNIDCYTLTGMLPELKEAYPWLKEVNAQSLQFILRSLDKAFINFFRYKKGFPKFKSKKSNYFSFSVSQSCKIINNKLYFNKLPSPIKIKLDRELNGKIKTVTISKNPSNQYFATILLEENSDRIPVQTLNENKTLGIDLGLTHFAILSNGNKIENPKCLKKSLKKLQRVSKQYSRKQKGGKNQEKSRLKLAKLHQKISNQRNDFLHKLTYNLTHDNQVTSLVIEDLNVAGMMRNKSLSRSIRDAGWGRFKQLLEYKSKWYGVNFITIDRFDPSSKMCSNCNYINKDLTFDQRLWTCECGVTHDRDINAATNIKEFGIEQYRRNYGNQSLLRKSLVTDLYETGNLSSNQRGIS